MLLRKNVNNIVMVAKPASNYLQQHEKSEGAIAGDIMEFWKRNYDNYARPARSEYYARQEERNVASPKSGDYGRFASSLKYTILPYGFNGVTEQLVPFSPITEEGLLGRTWIDTSTNPKIEINNELVGRARKAVRMHELMHQRKPYADEVTIRKETQKELLTQMGTTEGTYHEARYA